MDKRLCLKATTHVLRCVDKYGGLDNYLLQVEDKYLSAFGNWLRNKVRTQVINNKIAHEQEQQLQWHAEQLALYFEQHPEELRDAEQEETTLAPMSTAAFDLQKALDAKKAAHEAKWVARTKRNTGIQFRNKYKMYAEKYRVPVLYESQMTPEALDGIEQSVQEISKNIVRFESKKRRGPQTQQTNKQ